MISLIIVIIIVLLAILVSGLLTATERSIIAIRSSQIRELVAKGSKRAEFLRKLRLQPEVFFQFINISSTIALCITSFSAAYLVIKYLFPAIENIVKPDVLTWAKTAVIIVVLLIASFALIISKEFFGRLITLRSRELYALWVSAPIWYALTIIKPLLSINNWIVGIILMIFGVSRKALPEIPIGEADIRLMLRDGLEKGMFGEQEEKLLHSIFEFSDTTVRRAMTPRTEIIAIDINYPVDTILKIATEERFSRFPVYEESIDRILGIIHSRDLLYVFTHKDLFVLKDIIRKAHFVPDSKPIAELMREMKQSKFHMAIVLDEFGGTGGIITMEDVLEEIVGDIQDEYDRETSKIVFKESNIAVVKASMPIDEFANEFGVEVEDGEFDTVGGMIVTSLGRIPSRGEKISYSGYTLEVLDKDGHRITSVAAEKLPPKE